MEKFLEKLRMVLRKVYVALGVTAMPYLVHAGYGMPQPDPRIFTIPVQGRVVSEETGEPIAGIYVGYNVNVFNTVATNTDNDGRFFFYLPEDNTYSIFFIDKDGFENNGYFTEKHITISRDEIEDSLEINLYRESNFTVIRGTVFSKETGEPASEIRVYIGSTDGVAFGASGFIVISDDSGQFYIHVPERNTYYMDFVDINGLFRGKSISVTFDEIKNSLTVDLEKRK